MAQEDVALLARWNTRSYVCSIAVSNDGTRVVAGLLNDNIQVWDVDTGALVLQPRKGHKDTVCTVAFSPDDTRIVSGSRDCNLRIWDASTGAPIGKPLKGHTGIVKSVAFSPSGAYVVSGSFDGTIRLWDAHTRSPIGEPILRHTGQIRSVAFSPDSAHIVSGSDDCTVCIWDARTGMPIGEPLRHASPVSSMALSPNGVHIVSGLFDGSIHIWDAHTHSPIGKPLSGHIGQIRSVAFSPDSSIIVSGSKDRTIRIWDTRTGNPIGEPLRGHTQPVQSLAFSHDGTRIISGSKDRTICVWAIPRNTPSFDLVTSKMSAQEMFDCLVQHGCTDLTSSTDPDRHSSAVIASGGFGDVRRVRLDNGMFVAVKTLRLHILLKDDDKGVKRAVREVYMWSKLHHPNVQELLGIVVFQGGLGMVSPWMKQGNLQQYLAAHPDAERYPLCVQLASGVSYLHSIDMVHGDLKANNVLVSDEGTLKINDFDYAILSNSTLQFSTTTRPGGGTLRWMAPELFQPEDEEEDEGGEKEDGEDEAKSMSTRTTQTDVYALGMTMLEIVTGTVPYSEYRSDVGIYRAIHTKKPPRRPKELSGLDEQAMRMWELLLKCWDHNPLARPDASSVLALLRSLTV